MPGPRAAALRHSGACVSLLSNPNRHLPLQLPGSTAPIIFHVLISMTHHRLTQSHPSVTILSASADSTTLSAAITAANAATSSATGTQASLYPSIKTPTSTPGPNPHAPATTALPCSRRGIPIITAEHLATILWMDGSLCPAHRWL